MTRNFAESGVFLKRPAGFAGLFVWFLMRTRVSEIVLGHAANLYFTRTWLNPWRLEPMYKAVTGRQANLPVYFLKKCGILSSTKLPDQTRSRRQSKTEKRE